MSLVAGSGEGVPALWRVSGICAPSALHPGRKADAGCGFDRLKWRARAEIAGTTVNVGNLAGPCCSDAGRGAPALHGARRARANRAAGSLRRAEPRVNRSGKGNTFIIIPEAPLLPSVAVSQPTGVDA